MKLPKDILEAQNFLEQAEKESNPESNPEQKIYKLKKGMEILQFYLEDNPELSQNLKIYITNLRISHTRRLLSQLGPAGAFEQKVTVSD